MNVSNEKQIDYEVLATGSKGNAVRIENIMIDCGIPFKRMKESLYKCDTLLITHSHSDHIKESTLLKIMDEFPRIKIYGNYDVAYSYPTVNVIAEKAFTLRNGTIVTPFSGVHDVPVTYFVIQMGDTNIFYATDTCEVENLLGIKFDYIFLESNYDEHKLMTLGYKYKRKNYDPTDSSLRHLSTAKCKGFYYMNRKSKDSVLIELHMSERFY